MRELRTTGFEFVAKHVMTENEFLAELRNDAPQLILADYTLPGFDGLSALATALQESMVDDIQDPRPQGEPRKLQKLLVRSSRVVYLPLLHRARRVRSVGIPDFQQVRQQRDGAFVEPLFGAGLFVEDSDF
jgi:two-component system, NarL family, sensor histidine kinase UhpB